VSALVRFEAVHAWQQQTQQKMAVSAIGLPLMVLNPYVDVPGSSSSSNTGQQVIQALAAVHLAVGGVGWTLLCHVRQQQQHRATGHGAL